MWHKSLEKEWVGALGKRDSIYLAKLLAEINGDELFFSWLKYHGLVGLSKQICHQVGVDIGFDKELEGYNLRQIMGAMGVLQQAEQLIQLLHEEGIVAVLLKGGGLNQTVYPTVGLRLMGDIDLLVKDVDLERAVEIVAASGYHHAATADLKLVEIHAPPLIADKKGLVPVEIHWGLLPQDIRWFRSDYLDWFWSRLEPIGEEGKEIFIFDDVATLLHLSAHLVLWHGVHDISYKWLFDIDYLLKKGVERDGFWADLVDSADFLGWSDLVAVSLDIVADWVGSELPKEVRDQLEERRNEQIRAVIGGQSIDEAEYGRGVWGRLKMLHSGARWRAVWEILFPAPIYMRQKYKIVRWWQLPFGYGRRLWDIVLVFLGIKKKV